MKELPEYLQKIYDENKNELVIGEDMRVKKLVGIAEDEIDYLYVYDNGNDIELWSVMGGMIGYKATSYEYNYFGYSDKASWKDVVIGGRGTYHAYLDIDKLDVYGVFNAGIVVQQYTFDSNSPVAGESNTSSTNLNIYGGICAGAKSYRTLW